MINSILLRSLYTYLDVHPLSQQQETFLIHFSRIQNVKAAGRMVGVSPQVAREWFNLPSMQAVLQHLADEESYEFEVTRSMLNDMLMTAWSNCADATEQTGVVRELAKINGHYPGGNNAGNVFNAQINIGRDGDGETKGAVKFKNIKYIQQLSDDELAKIAGNRFAEALIEQKHERDEADDMVYDAGLDMHVPINEAGQQ